MNERLPPATPGAGSSASGTSVSLLECVRGSNQEAWRRLVQLYNPLVFSWVRRSGLGDSDAADVVQDVWHSAATALPRFRHDQQAGTFRGWLWTITRNKVYDHFRKREGEPAASGGSDARKLLESIPEQEPPDATGMEEHQLLHRALEQIRPEFESRTWQAFWRMTVDGQTAADVGQELDLAANAVHQAKFRVLRRLREEMAGLVEV